VSLHYTLVANRTSGLKQAPNPALLHRAKRGNLIEFPPGTSIVRLTDSSTSLGYRKKRTLRCNDTDIGLNVTEHESAPTSGRCLIARKMIEPYLERNANEGVIFFFTLVRLSRKFMAIA
jgi:hypothetical protein